MGGADAADAEREALRALAAAPGLGIDAVYALLERWRTDRTTARDPHPDVVRALLLSVNGIAAGLRNTG